MRRHQRTADPFATNEREVVSRLGVDTQRDLRQRDRDNNIRTIDSFPVLVCTTLSFFRDDPVAAGANATRMIVPTGAAVFGAVAGIGGYPASRSGAVVRAYLWSNEARTAGSLFVRVRITDGAAVVTEYDFTDCVLDGGTDPISGEARTQVASQAHTFADGIPYAAGDLIDVRLITDAGWLPTTADVSVNIVLAEQEWIDA